MSFLYALQKQPKKQVKETHAEVVGIEDGNKLYTTTEKSPFKDKIFLLHYFLRHCMSVYTFFVSN